MKRLYSNVVALDSGARGATTSFEGPVLLDYLETGDDAAAVVRHLLGAGLVVLVEAPTDDAAEALASGLDHVRRWDSAQLPAATADDIARSVLQMTMLNTALGPDNWVI